MTLGNGLPGIETQSRRFLRGIVWREYGGAPSNEESPNVQFGNSENQFRVNNTVVLESVA